jgi:hypothetical protein
MESSSIVIPVAAIAAEHLELPVRRALGRPNARVIDWRREDVTGGAGFIATIHRFTGTADDNGQSVSWSLILKAIGEDEDEDLPPTDYRYWKREPLAYESGLLDELPGGCRAPRCFGSVVADDGAWLWLEDVRDDLGPQWPFEHYGVVARHLGQLNGTHLRDRELLLLPWLTTGGLATWVEQAAPAMADFSTTIDHPLFARIYTAEVAERVLRLWGARQPMIETIARFPQTFCHLDAFRRNIIGRRTERGEAESVLLDWAFAGAGALGEELAPLVAATVTFDATMEWQCLPDLDQLAFNGYLDGLRDAGWRGNRDEVRFVYAAAAELRHCVGVTRFVLQDVDARGRAVGGAGWRDPANQANAEAMFGRPFDEMVEHLAGMFGWLTALGDEALRLSSS